MLHDVRWRFLAIEAATGYGQDDVLVAGQAFRSSGFVVAEGLAGDRDAIDPGLELGGDREVVERHADHDGVGGQELLDHGVTEREVVAQRVVVRSLQAAARCREIDAGEMGDRFRGQVAIGDADAEGSLATRIGSIGNSPWALPLRNAHAWPAPRRFAIARVAWSRSASGCAGSPWRST